MCVCKTSLTQFERIHHPQFTQSLIEPFDIVGNISLGILIKQVKVNVWELNENNYTEQLSTRIPIHYTHILHVRISNHASCCGCDRFVNIYLTTNQAWNPRLVFTLRYLCVGFLFCSTSSVFYARLFSVCVCVCVRLLCMPTKWRNNNNDTAARRETTSWHFRAMYRTSLVQHTCFARLLLHMWECASKTA